MYNKIYDLYPQNQCVIKDDLLEWTDDQHLFTDIKFYISVTDKRNNRRQTVLVQDPFKRLRFHIATSKMIWFPGSLSEAPGTKMSEM